MIKIINYVKHNTDAARMRGGGLCAFRWPEARDNYKSQATIMIIALFFIRKDFRSTLHSDA